MKAITLSIFLSGLCCGFAMTANAQTADHQDWQAVMRLPAAANVRVETKDKHKKTAWLVAATDTEVKLEDDGEVFTYRRDAIKKTLATARAQSHQTKNLF